MNHADQLAQAKVCERNHPGLHCLAWHRDSIIAENDERTDEFAKQGCTVILVAAVFAIS